MATASGAGLARAEVEHARAVGGRARERALVERVGPVALDAEHAGDRSLTAVEGADAPPLGREHRDREPAQEPARAQDGYERRHPRRCLGAPQARPPGRAAGRSRASPSARRPGDAPRRSCARPRATRAGSPRPATSRWRPGRACRRATAATARGRAGRAGRAPARRRGPDRRWRRPAMRPGRSRARRPTRRRRSTIFVSESRPVPQTACMTLRACPGIGLADRDDAAVVEGAGDRQVVVDELGQRRAQRGQEEALGGLAEPGVLGRRRADEDARVDRVAAHRHARSGAARGTARPACSSRCGRRTAPRGRARRARSSPRARSRRARAPAGRRSCTARSRPACRAGSPRPSSRRRAWARGTSRRRP